MSNIQNLEKKEAQENVFVDLLDREKLAENFLNVVLSQNVGVYSINAPWGAGKTYFLKFVEKACSKQNVPFIQYNIWETDYLDNPLKSILNEFLNLIIQLECDEYITQEIKDLAKKTKQFASQFIETLKNFGFHIDWVSPSFDGMGSLQMGIEKSPSVESDEYDKMKTLKNEIKNNLKKIVATVPSNKIIIGIDELDRCRPDYAIKTLEIIKHFFDIDKLVFVLAVDKEQLKNTVKVLYGINADTDCYLKKFVDIEYLLPRPNTRTFIKYLVEKKFPSINETYQNFNQIRSVFVKNTNGEWFCINVRNSAYLTETLSDVIENYEMELRDIEKIILKLSIIINQIPQTSILCLPFLMDLVILNTYHPYIYNYIKKKAPADNYNDYQNLKKLRRETYIIIKYMHLERAIENNIYECREDLKGYFDLIDFAQNFRT